MAGGLQRFGAARVLVTPLLFSLAVNCWVGSPETTVARMVVAARSGAAHALIASATWFLRPWWGGGSFSAAWRADDILLGAEDVGVGPFFLPSRAVAAHSAEE